MRQCVEVALHGFNHQTNRREEAGGNSEFEGLGYDEQYMKISRGKAILENQLGLKITTFVPPWNSYDSTTLRVLEVSGFSTISAGLWGTCEGSSRLSFIPSTCSLSFEALKGAVLAARRGT